MAKDDPATGKRHDQAKKVAEKASKEIVNKFVKETKKNLDENE